MSLDSNDSQHLWAHGHQTMSSKSKEPSEKTVIEESAPKPGRGRERVQFRRYLILQRVTRKSWPTSSIG